MSLSKNQYYPRIAIGHMDYEGTPYHEVILSARHQLGLLHESLRDIFKYVQPDICQQDVFSHQIRNLILLAATEFEAQCIGILEANNVMSQGRYFNTNDYVRLNPVLKLDQYTCRLAMFPAYPPVSPFGGWDPSNPTTSLNWYDAYNKTKHNRESEFSHASLHNAIQAVAACTSIYFAQTLTWDMNPENLGFPNSFRYESSPAFGKSELYSFGVGPKIEVPYPF